MVSDLNVSTSGYHHILTIIDQLKGWTGAFPISDKKADTIFHVFMNNCLPTHMYPHFILADNSTELKNQLIENVLQQLGIDCMSSAPYYPQSNGKLEVFCKYLKYTIKKHCEKDLDNWVKYINQVLVSYHVTPPLTTAETPFFLVYGRDPNLPLHQLLEPM